MTVADPPNMRALDAETRAAAVDAVEAAKARGWTQDDLRTWFEGRGVALTDYLEAKAGGPISAEARSALATVSITGLPSAPTRQEADDAFPDIPDAMKAAARWLLWKREPNDDPTKKPRKVPYYATGERRSGGLDGPEDVARLTTYSEACAALAYYPGYAGLGFALGEDATGHCWQGIDLDNLDQHPGLQFVADDLPGYTERSPSGGGVHAIGYGRPFDALGSNPTGIEAYSRGRYFTVTGESTGMADIACLADFVERRLAPLHSHRPQDTSSAATGGSLAGALAATDLRSALASMRADDRDLWIRMGLALKELGDAGRGLWLEWSQTSEKYDPVDASRTWETFKPERTGYQAVFAEAQRQGWVNPAMGQGVALAAADPGHSTTPPEDRFAPDGFQGVTPGPRPWAYGNILMYQAVTGIAAPPGVGKTTFSFQFGLAVALDREFGTWAPAAGGGGKVWLYNGEEPRDELDRRFLAACIEMGVQEREASARFAYNSGLVERLMLVRQDPKSGELIRSPDVDLIKARIIAHGFKVFIVDPLIEFHGAKEDTEGFHAVGAVLREIAHDCDCAVLFFHHTPKAANSDTAAGDMNAMRGGGPIVGVARFVATMFNMTAKDAEEYQIPAKERTRYVRFDDAKANMTQVSAEPQWWIKLGVGIDNGDGVRPADNIGVLRFQKLRGAGEPQGLEQAMARESKRQAALQRIAEEMARVCVANGHASLETAVTFDAIFRALDPIKTGFGIAAAKDIASQGMGQGWKTDAGSVVITTIPRGSQTIRKVHFEEVNDVR